MARRAGLAAPRVVRRVAFAYSSERMATSLVVLFVTIVAIGLWAAGAILVGQAAEQRGQDKGRWSLLAVAISPMLALFLLLVTTPPPDDRFR
jgi:hypothetical protein